jgi:comEA protein
MKSIAIIMSLLFCSVVFAQMPDVSDASKKMDAAAASGKDGSLKDQAMKKALVNLNTASQADLEKVPGIGPVRAKAIIDARPYSSVKDLAKVKGIKEGLIAKIKPYVTI